MKATRIKWDEAMLIRCLARLEDYNPAPVVVKQKEAAMEEVNDFSMKFDIPVESPAADSEAEVNDFSMKFDIPVESPATDSEAEVNDFSLEFDMPAESPAADFEVKKKTVRPDAVKKEADYSFKWDKLPACMFQTSGAQEKNVSWEGFREAVDMAM